MGAKTMSHEEFVRMAIAKLRKDPYKGIHTVYSGFNAAWRDYYGTDPIVATRALAESGKIEITGARGGAMLYFPGEAPKRNGNGKKALATMGL